MLPGSCVLESRREVDYEATFEVAHVVRGEPKMLRTSLLARPYTSLFFSRIRSILEFCELANEEG